MCQNNNKKFLKSISLKSVKNARTNQKMQKMQKIAENAVNPAQQPLEAWKMTQNSWKTDGIFSNSLVH